MQKKWIITSWLCLFIWVGFIGCKSDSSKMDNEEISQKADNLAKEDDAHLPEEFLDFYDKFHDDSEYQLAHISWPLRGIPGNSEPGEEKKILDNFVWKKKDWKMHHRLRDENFTQSFAFVDEKMIIERIDMNGTNLRLERRFAKLGGDEWKLIYYMAMNPVKLDPEN